VRPEHLLEELDGPQVCNESREPELVGATGIELWPLL
jgi:hypothetical protein